MILLFQLFWSYLKIGFFGFGGGYGMLSLIQHEIVVSHGWLTPSQFSDIVAVSQITPGPIAINSATYVGYTVGLQHGGVLMGFLAALVATVSVCMPALTIMLLITKFFLKLKGNVYVDKIVSAMQPVVIGMIASAALLLIFPLDDDPSSANFVDLWSWLIFAAVFVASLKKVNPITLIVLSSLAGVCIYYLPTLF